MNSRKAITTDIDGILDLQEKNLHARLTTEERQRGFVTTPFAQDQIEEAIRSDGLFITEKTGQIIAYAFAGTWSFFEQWPIFPYMTSRFSELSFKDFEITIDCSFQYGPVCIDINYRGKGVLNSVFEEMRVEWMKRFSLSITFINKINEVSTRAHEKLGWEIIDKFEFDSNQYFGLAYDMKKSAL